MRLAMGALLCVAVIPAAVTVVNFTWLRENPRWEFLRTSHLELAVEWWNSASGMHVRVPRADRVLPPQELVLPTIPKVASTGLEKPAVKGPPPPFSSLLVPGSIPIEQSTPSWILTFKLLERLAKACTWIGGFLLLVGLAGSWRLFLRPEHLTLCCLNLLLLVIMRIRYGTAGIDLRYFMPMVIVGVPWMALGLEHFIAAVGWLLQRRGVVWPQAMRGLAGTLIVLAVAFSFLDGPMPAAAYMRKRAALGHWILNHARPEPALAGNLDRLTADTFYCNGRVIGTFGPRDCLIVPMPAAISERSADVIVLWNKENLGHEHLDEIQRRVAYYGYRPANAKELPTAEDELMVFVRK